MKWKDLTPEQLRSLASDFSDHAHDMGIDREQLEEENGFDVVAGYKCVVRRLMREALRREKAAMPDPVDAGGEVG